MISSDNRINMSLLNGLKKFKSRITAKKKQVLQDRFIKKNQNISTLCAKDIPVDLIERIMNLEREPLNRKKYNELFYACYGRVQYMSAVGMLVATLITKKLSRLGIVSSSNASPELVALEREGAVNFDPGFPKSRVNDVLSFFLERPCLNGHHPTVTRDKELRFVGKSADDEGFGCYRSSDIFSAPYLLEYVLSDHIIETATAYLGAPPTLLDLQAWWNFPGFEEHSVFESYNPCSYHRDLNDLRMFWLYIYLTDVDVDSAPHQILSQTSDINVVEHNLLKALNSSSSIQNELQDLDVQDFFYQYGYQIPDKIKNTLFSDLEKTFIGKAGTTFISNGIHFHRVKSPIKQKRLMFAARFSINPPTEHIRLREGASIPENAIFDRVNDNASIRYVLRNFI